MGAQIQAHSTLVVALVTKAPREGASFITSQSELGVIGGGGGGCGGRWPKLVGFFGYPPSGAGKNPWLGACFGPDFGPFG